MTRDDIIKLMREAGFESNSLGATYTSGWLPDLLERFAVLVAEAEREASAKVCDARYTGDNNREDIEARRCAKAIRARGNK
jgi:triphosphoribosyl-dephospho-CoA synthetase